MLFLLWFSSDTCQFHHKAPARLLITSWSPSLRNTSACRENPLFWDYRQKVARHDFGQDLHNCQNWSKLSNCEPVMKNRHQGLCVFRLLRIRIEPLHDETCFCNSRSLINAFVVRCLDSIISLVSISKISSLYLASVAAQAGLSLTWSQTPKTGFSSDVDQLSSWHPSFI